MLRRQAATHGGGGANLIRAARPDRGSMPSQTVGAALNPAPMVESYGSSLIQHLGQWKLSVRESVNVACSNVKHFS